MVLMFKTRKSLIFSFLLISLLIFSSSAFADDALVFQSDFGLKDGAVSAMQGVAYGVDSDLDIFDLSHEITPFDIWEGAYRLFQTAGYWPKGTVFVSVVDPGVGTDRKSVVLKTKTGHYFVTPDNGTLTLVADNMGIAEIREIDENKHRLQGSEASHTFHGRDVYAYTGAKIASENTDFEDIGPKLENKVVRLDYQKAAIKADKVMGTIPILDIQYGNIWTNIPKKLFDQLEPEYGDHFKVKIYQKDELVYEGTVPYAASFGDVEKGEPVLYQNSLLNLSLALNWDNFSAVHGVNSGPEWKFTAEKID